MQVRVHKARRNDLAPERSGFRPAEVDRAIHRQQVIDRLPPLSRRGDVHRHVIARVACHMNRIGEVPRNCGCILTNECAAVRREQRPYIGGDAALRGQGLGAFDLSANVTGCPNCHWLCSRSFAGILSMFLKNGISSRCDGVTIAAAITGCSQKIFQYSFCVSGMYSSRTRGEHRVGFFDRGHLTLAEK